MPDPVNPRLANPFLAAVHQGKNEWWRYLLSLMLMGGVFFLLTVALIVVALVAGWMTLAGDTVDVGDPLVGYVLGHLPFGFWLLGTGLAVQQIHQRPVFSLIRATGDPRLWRLAQGFGVWLLLVGLPLILALWGEGLAVSEINWGQWILLLGLAVIFTPLQVAAEEVFFRGYFLQGTGLFTRNPGILCLINGLVFLWAHGDNPELGYSLFWLSVYYFAFGSFTTWLTLRDQGLELALGMHMANNMFVVLLVSYDDAVIDTPALFQASELDPVAVVLAFGVRALIFSALVFGIPRLGGAAIKKI